MEIPSTSNTELNASAHRTSINRNSSTSELCTFFFQQNWCKFGNNCKYSHFSSTPYDSNVPNFSRTYHNKFPNFRSNYVEIRHQGAAHFSQKMHFQNKQLCKFFKAGKCDSGNKCSYSHENTPKKIPSCRLFKKGQCNKGDYCRFDHHVPISSVNQSQMTSSTSKDSNYVPDISNLKLSDTKCLETRHADHQKVSTTEFSECKRSEETIKKDGVTSAIRNVSAGIKIYELATISESELNRLRETEIVQFKRRFPKCEVVVGNEAFKFEFKPSDPEWPFEDCSILGLEAYFPDKYPVEAFKITIQQTGDIPNILLRYLNETTEAWIHGKHQETLKQGKVELLFRPFLRWFDKSLEELFINGLRKVKLDVDAQKSGIEFIPHENLFPQQNETDIQDHPLDNNGESYFNQDLSPNHNVHPSPNPADTNDNKPLGDTNPKQPIPPESLRNNQTIPNLSMSVNVKIMFADVELTEGIGAMKCTKLGGTLNCHRCRTTFNALLLPIRNVSKKCLKCHRGMVCAFDPLIMHEFSSVVGNARLTDCQIIDVNLVESSFMVDCLNCSKQTTVNGMHYGQKQKRWCSSCNHKFELCIQSVKLQASAPGYVEASSASAKRAAKKKDVMIRQGDPLPESGTCKHYKKSFRWLRFPCCGRLYPCDICHDEKERDHEMKFANRMVCGFCSKEQPYTKDKPCISCSGSTTPKAGAHWEGGKGCRNKINMAREDRQKYVGVCKTVSRKAESAGGKGKKS